MGYYKEVLQLKKGKGDAIKIAEHMESDYIFSFYFLNENVEKVVNGLKMVEALSGKQNLVPLASIGKRRSKRYSYRHNRRKMIYWILQCLEATKNITIQPS